MKKVFIRGSVPTSYQFNSLNTLGVTKKHADGSFSVDMEFNSEEEAKEYLRERLSWIYNNTDMTEEQYNEALESIESGSLSYDAATVYIEE